MRIDLRTRPLDPRWRDYDCYLDGVKLPLCVMADEEAGVAITHQVIDGQLVHGEDFRAIEFGHSGRVELRPVEQP